MKAQAFSLQPFSGDALALPVSIGGLVALQGGLLRLGYHLSGDLSAQVIPSPAEAPGRGHGLWQTTCLEFFLAPGDAPGYWEFNLSPAGHWNVYRFTGYRQGMIEEPAFTALPFSVQRTREALRMDLQVELGRIIPPSQPLQMGISAVCQGKDGGLHYFALAHPVYKPDFHHRDGFILGL